MTTTTGILKYSCLSMLYITAALTCRAAQLDDTPVAPLKPSSLLDKSTPIVVTPISVIPYEVASVYFLHLSSKLTPQAKSILDQQVGYLNQYPHALVDLMGHADTQENAPVGSGKAKADMDLGLERAQAVKAYLVSKGISKERVFAKTIGSEGILPADQTPETMATLRVVDTRAHQSN